MCWFYKHVFISALIVSWEEAVSLAICVALIFSDLYRILHHEYIPMPPQQNNADVIIQLIGNLIIFEKFIILRGIYEKEKGKGKKEKKLCILWSNRAVVFSPLSSSLFSCSLPFSLPLPLFLFRKLLNQVLHEAILIQSGNYLYALIS